MAAVDAKIQVSITKVDGALYTPVVANLETIASDILLAQALKEAASSLLLGNHQQLRAYDGNNSEMTPAANEKVVVVLKKPSTAFAVMTNAISLYGDKLVGAIGLCTGRNTLTPPAPFDDIYMAPWWETAMTSLPNWVEVVHRESCTGGVGYSIAARVAKAYNHNRMKVIVYGTHPDIHTGYSKVARMTAKALEDAGHIVYHVAFDSNDMSVSSDAYKRVRLINVNHYRGAVPIESTRPGRFGQKVLHRLASMIKPDAAFLYNDVNIICGALNHLWRGSSACPAPSMRIVVYLDMVSDFHSPGKTKRIVQQADSVYFYSQHWEDHVKSNAGKAFFALDDSLADRVGSFPHGYLPVAMPMVARDDLDMSKRAARRSIGLPEDAIVVLNMNRDDTRKMHSITIEAFVEFVATRFPDDPGEAARRCRLFLTASNQTKIACRLNAALAYYDNGRLLTDAAWKAAFLDTPMVTRIPDVFGTPDQQVKGGGGLSEEQVSILQMAATVGVNTTTGEGFGLCQLEGVVRGFAPQVATHTGGLIDIAAAVGDDTFFKTVKPSVRLHSDTDGTAFGGVMEYVSSSDIAAAIAEVVDAWTPAKAMIASEAARNAFSVSKYSANVCIAVAAAKAVALVPADSGYNIAIGKYSMASNDGGCILEDSSKSICDRVACSKIGCLVLTDVDVDLQRIDNTVREVVFENLGNPCTSVVPMVVMPGTVIIRDVGKRLLTFTDEFYTPSVNPRNIIKEILS